MSVPFPTSSVASRFAGIIDTLCHIIPKLIARDREAGPLIILIHNHLRRLGARFAAIAARAQAGTLPAPRCHTARRKATRPAVRLSPRLLPYGYAWLIKVFQETACGGQYLYHLVLNDPEMAALLAASPQAGRIVRSIFWMTAIRPVPEIVRHVSAPRAPRKAPIRIVKACAIPGRASPDAHSQSHRSPPYRPSAHWPRSCGMKPAWSPRRLHAKGPPWPD